MESISDISPPTAFPTYAPNISMFAHIPQAFVAINCTPLNKGSITALLRAPWAATRLLIQILEVNVLGVFVTTCAQISKFISFSSTNRYFLFCTIALLRLSLRNVADVSVSASLTRFLK